MPAYRPGLLTVCLIALAAFLPVRTDAGSVRVKFYTEQLTVTYADDFAPSRVNAINEQGLTAFYRLMAKSPYQPLLESLQSHRERLGLNDWLYYRLMHQSVAQIFTDKTEIQRELTCWFLLAESGFDARLTYLGKKVFINVYTDDEVFVAPLITDRGRSFVNISFYFGAKSHLGTPLYLLDFIPNKTGKPFSFYMPTIPALQSVDTLRELSFEYEGETYRMNLIVDGTVAEIMKGYPLISEFQYMAIPMSPRTNESIAAAFKPWLEGKTLRKRLEMLVTFTRSAFNYAEDKAVFGSNKPMVAEEVFFYPQSDCEDRVALCYNLVKQLLDLPMIVIAYPDHLTLAVALPDTEGASVTYNGRQYLFCDPTGPVNSSEIGLIPKGYEHQQFEIIGHYK
jgi:hypothetical protein